MKTSAIIRIVVFSLLILILIGILGGVLGFGMYMADGKVQYDRTEVVESPVMEIEQGEITSQVRNIEIEWAAGSITIQQDDAVQSIRVTEYCSPQSEYQMVMKQSGQTLKIQFSKESIKFPSFGINASVSKDLVIHVPSDWAGNSIEIDAAAADVHIAGLQINELDFDGASGKLLLENCDIVDLDIDTASGDVEFSGILKNLDFDAASAKFTGEFFQMPNHLNMDTMSGDLDIVLPEYCGFELTLDNMSGTFDTDFEVGTYNNTYISGEGECKINVSAMSGDVRIYKAISSPNADVRCTDSDCTDPAHGHTIICNDSSCTDPDHDHSGICTNETCTDTSHGHSDHH